MPPFKRQREIPVLAGLLCVERCEGGWFQEVEPGEERWKQALKVVAREETGSGGGNSQPLTTWACYPDRQSVEDLLHFLNPKGNLPFL